jgi:CRISPR/Cas system CSM-associated protein Csm3 (group 7 of RAMP superfamily)
MMIEYKIEFLSEWHIGSGLGAGAESDAAILVDANKMPYIPGKTIKGLLRDVMNDIYEVQPNQISKQDILDIFGQESELKREDKLIQGKAYFSNATLEANEYNAIVANELQEYLLKNVASTAINQNGVANEKSLRSREVCMPLTLHGTIHIEEKHKDKIVMATKWIRGAGVNRNRGLGRCKITIKIFK